MPSVDAVCITEVPSRIFSDKTLLDGKIFLSPEAELGHMEIVSSVKVTPN